MSDTTTALPSIRVYRLQPLGTQTGFQKSPTTEDEKTPKKIKKPVLKKSVSFENGVKGEYEGRGGVKK